MDTNINVASLVKPLFSAHPPARQERAWQVKDNSKKTDQWLISSNVVYTKWYARTG